MRAKNAPFVLDNWQKKKKRITYFLSKDQYVKERDGIWVDGFDIS